MVRAGFSPSKFFADRELNARTDIGTVDDLWEILKEEQAAGEGDRGQLRDLTSSQLLFRGQSNGAFGLSASLHRALKADVSESIAESQMYAAEVRIRERASSMGLGKGLNALEVQQILQHHHAPTRLLDVSRTPMEALFFATEDRDLTEGRLFVLEVRPDGAVDLDQDHDDLPWARYVRGLEQATGEWTQAVNIIDGRPLDPRMIAQDGIFLVGGLRRAYANLNMHFESVILSADELQMISMLTIGFPKGAASSMGQGWPALGWTIRIPGDWKRELRRRLHTEYNISHPRMYPPLESLKWEGEAAVRS